MNTYEINLNTVTYELVETYNRLLHNDVCIADTYRDRAIENFEGAVGLFVFTGRIKDNEEAFDYIEALKTRLSNCRKSFEEYNDEILIDYEKIGDECHVITAVSVLERLVRCTGNVVTNY